MDGAVLCLLSLGRLLRENTYHTLIRKNYSLLGLLLSGRISLGKAAELLSLRIDELWEIMSKLGIKHSILNEEVVEEELYAYKKVFKSNT